MHIQWRSGCKLSFQTIKTECECALCENTLVCYTFCLGFHVKPEQQEQHELYIWMREMSSFLLVKCLNLPKDTIQQYNKKCVRQLNMYTNPIWTEINCWRSKLTTTAYIVCWWKTQNHALWSTNENICNQQKIKKRRSTNFHQFVRSFIHICASVLFMDAINKLFFVLRLFSPLACEKRACELWEYLSMCNKLSDFTFTSSLNKPLWFHQIWIVYIHITTNIHHAKMSFPHRIWRWWREKWPPFRLASFRFVSFHFHIFVNYI